MTSGLEAPGFDDGRRGTRRVNAVLARAVAAAVAVTLTLAPGSNAWAQSATGTQPDGDGEGATAEPVYRIASGDVIEIEVFGEPDLSGERTVRPDGRVDAPLLGAVRAFGRSPSELARVLETRYGNFLADPRLSVRVVRATGLSDRAVYVIGRGLAQPQRLRYRAGMRAVDVLTALGTLPPTAAPEDAYLLRDGPDGTRERIGVDLERAQDAGPGSARTDRKSVV